MYLQGEGEIWDREGHKHKVKRLSNIAREIEVTRKPRRGEALMNSEDEKREGRAMVMGT